MPLIPKPGTAWVYVRCRDAAPEAFHDDRLLDYRGGALLVHAVTQRPAGERRYGNFPTHAHYPEV